MLRSLHKRRGAHVASRFSFVALKDKCVSNMASPLPYKELGLVVCRRQQSIRKYNRMQISCNHGTLVAKYPWRKSVGGESFWGKKSALKTSVALVSPHNLPSSRQRSWALSPPPPSHYLSERIFLSHFRSLLSLWPLCCDATIQSNGMI